MSIAQHEARHLFAAAAALVEIGLDRESYDRLRVAVEAGPQGGEMALMPTADLPEATHVSAMRLAAFGPLAVDAGAVRKLVAGNGGLDDRMARSCADAALSEEDYALVSSYAGPPLLPAIIVAAVQQMEARLGLAGMARLGRLLNELASADIAEPPRIGAFVPYEIAKTALDQARADLHAGAAP